MQNTERQLITGVPGQNIYIQVRKVIKYVIVCLGILSLGFRLYYCPLLVKEKGGMLHSSLPALSV